MTKEDSNGENDLDQVTGVEESPAEGLGRRDFVKFAGAGAGLLALGGCQPGGTAEAVEPRGAPWLEGAPGLVTNGGSPDVVIVGAGAFGGWSGLHLADMGAKVTIVDAWGPGNSRATSGDETRGIRTAYGLKEHWTRMASESIKRWRAWDEEWGRELQIGLYFDTGDIILRPRIDPLIRDSMTTWDTLGIEYELLESDEIKYRWPQITGGEDAAVGLYEVNAGVARARRSCEAVAEVFRRKGGSVTIARAEIGETANGQISNLSLSNGETISAGQYVFALGPWMRTFFPEVLGPHMRTPLASVYYFATPKGDSRYIHPNMPTWNIPATTGWPSLPVDARGFRIRTGGLDDDDPDTSARWVPPESQERARSIIAEWFPGLVGMPILETRACHYESGLGRDFLVDHHPDYTNTWLAGLGNSEGFKQGPVIGDIVARRVMGAEELWPDLGDRFRYPDDLEAPATQGGGGPGGSD